MFFDCHPNLKTDLFAVLAVYFSNYIDLPLMRLPFAVADKFVYYVGIFTDIFIIYCHCHKTHINTEQI